MKRLAMMRTHGARGHTSAMALWPAGEGLRTHSQSSAQPRHDSRARGRSAQGAGRRPRPVLEIPATPLNGSNAAPKGNKWNSYIFIKLGVFVSL